MRVALAGVCGTLAVALHPLPAVAAPEPDTGLLGATTAAGLPATVVGEQDVVPQAQQLRLGRVGGSVSRVAGPNRYLTAVQVSRRFHPEGAAEVVLATGSAFPDAMVAGPLAARLGAPLLLVTAASLPAAVAAELTRLGPRRVTVVGGPAVVGDAVLAAARAAAGGSAVTTRRLAGQDRYGTAQRVAATFPAGVPGVVLATGANFPDAVASIPLAHAMSGPLVISPPTALPAGTRGELIRLRPARLVVAGEADVVPAAVAAAAGTATGRTPERVAGRDRYATAAALAESVAEIRALRGVFVATGLNFPDALTAGAAAATTGSALLLTAPGSLRSAVLAADVARLRGVGRWVQLALDAVARTRALPDTAHAAYLRAYLADSYARLYGWADPEVTEQLTAMRASRRPGGGYGLDVAYDAFHDGTVNPTSTRYLVTITDHVGRALLDGLAAGAVSSAEVGDLVDRVLAWPRTTGDPACLAYSDSPNDRRWCVYNVSSGAGWFLRAAWDLGVRRSGQLELAELVAAHDRAIEDGTGWWPYSNATPGVRQDWNHNAWTIEAHLTLSPALGTRALGQVMAGGPSHPDPALRLPDDAMGYLRLLPFACGHRTGVDAAARTIIAQQRIASDAGQVALWAARTAQACGG